MDVLDEYSDTLGARLATLMRPLIDQDLSVVFYDLTTLSVTGQTDLEENVRAYGRSKSGLVERQFMLSLVQTAEGLPIAHEVNPGNTAEAKTLLPMIRSLLARYPLKRVAGGLHFAREGIRLSRHLDVGHDANVLAQVERLALDVDGRDRRHLLQQGTNLLRGLLLKIFHWINGFQQTLKISLLVK